jgi:hypothetical protein
VISQFHSHSYIDQQQIFVVGRGEYLEFGLEDRGDVKTFTPVPFKHSPNEDIINVVHGWGILVITTANSPRLKVKRVIQFSDVDIIVE